MNFKKPYLFAVALAFCSLSLFAQTNKIFTATNGAKLYLPDNYKFDKIVLSAGFKTENGFASGTGNIKLYTGDVLGMDVSGKLLNGYREGSFKGVNGRMDSLYSNFNHGKLFGEYSTKEKNGNTRKGIFLDTTGNALIRMYIAATGNTIFGWFDRNIVSLGNNVSFRKDTVMFFFSDPKYKKSAIAWATKKNNWSLRQLENGNYNGLYIDVKPWEVVVGDMSKDVLMRTTSSARTVNEAKIWEREPNNQESLRLYDIFNNTVGEYFSSAPQKARVLDYVKMEAAPARYINGKFITTYGGSSLQTMHKYTTVTSKDGEYVFTGKVFYHATSGTYKTKEGYTRYGELSAEQYIDGLGIMTLKSKKLKIFGYFYMQGDDSKGFNIAKTISQLRVDFDDQKNLITLCDMGLSNAIFNNANDFEGGTSSKIAEGDIAFHLRKSRPEITIEQAKYKASMVSVVPTGVIFGLPSGGTYEFKFGKEDDVIVAQIMKLYQ